MLSTPTKPTTIDEYIASFPKEVQKVLKQLRQAIKKAAPKAEETISYGIATFKLHGNLVHFGGYKNHVGFYPAPAGIKAFEKELAPYISSKATLRFELDKPLPLELITRVVKYRMQQNEAKQKKNK